MKSPSPLLGFNNNVRHKGRVFHIQTEDSGIRHPHIITHLFADGGRILKTTKTSYAEHIGQATMAETVRALMQEQHKAMFVALRDGQFDHLVEGERPSSQVIPPASVRKPEGGSSATPSQPSRLSQPPSQPSQPPQQASQPPQPPPQAPKPAPQAPPPPPQASQPPPQASQPPPQASQPPPQASQPPPQVLPPPATQPAAMQSTSLRPSLDLKQEPLLGRTSRDSSPAPASVKPSPSIDLDALERAAEEAQSPFFQQIQDLPPPPTAVLAKKPPQTSQSGGYRAVTPTSSAQAEPASAPPDTSAIATSRYAQSRPASIFGTTRPAEGASIFGEDLISEKSLDEVILSYLAEDLDSPSEKK